LKGREESIKRKEESLKGREESIKRKEEFIKVPYVFDQVFNKTSVFVIFFKKTVQFIQ
jgi:hypothetical protein